MAISDQREAVFARYRAKLPGWAFQRHLGSRTAHTDDASGSSGRRNAALSFACFMPTSR